MLDRDRRDKADQDHAGGALTAPARSRGTRQCLAASDADPGAVTTLSDLPVRQRRGHDRGDSGGHDVSELSPGRRYDREPRRSSPSCARSCPPSSPSRVSLYRRYRTCRRGIPCTRSACSRLSLRRRCGAASPVMRRSSTRRASSCAQLNVGGGQVTVDRGRIVGWRRRVQRGKLSHHSLDSAGKKPERSWRSTTAHRRPRKAIPAMAGSTRCSS